LRSVPDRHLGRGHRKCGVHKVFERLILGRPSGDVHLYVYSLRSWLGLASGWRQLIERLRVVLGGLLRRRHGQRRLHTLPTRVLLSDKRRRLV